MTILDPADQALLDLRFHQTARFHDIADYAARMGREFLSFAREDFSARNGRNGTDAEAYVLTAEGRNICQYLENFARARAEGVAYADAVEGAINMMNFSLNAGIMADTDMLEPLFEMRDRGIGIYDGNPDPVVIERASIQDAQCAVLLLRTHFRNHCCFLPGFARAIDKISGDFDEVLSAECGVNGLARQIRVTPETKTLYRAMDWLSAQIARGVLFENGLLQTARAQGGPDRITGEALAANDFYLDLCCRLNAFYSKSVEDGSYVDYFGNALVKSGDLDAPVNPNLALYTYLHELLEVHLQGFESPESDEAPEFPPEQAKPFVAASGMLMQEFAKVFPLPARQTPLAQVAMIAPPAP